MFAEYMTMVHEVHPLVHNITNYVTVHACANLLLACGASPIMADEEEEVEEIVSLCHSLNLNMGTLNLRTIGSMKKAGAKANEQQKPIVLDPVGVGASKLRTDTAFKLLEEVDFSVIRGNLSEIKMLAQGSGKVRGVDVSTQDQMSKERILDLARDFSRSTGAITVITGAVDYVSDGTQTYCLLNGHPLMGKVTGTGCQLSALLAAYVGANKDHKLEAAVTAVALWGLAGELAQRRMTSQDGNMTYANYLIDAVFTMTVDQLETEVRYEIH